MYTCIYCGYQIDGRTDDNYDMSHDNIKCPNCEKWMSTWREYETHRPAH